MRHIIAGVRGVRSFLGSAASLRCVFRTMRRCGAKLVQFPRSLGSGLTALVCRERPLMRVLRRGPCIARGAVKAVSHTEASQVAEPRWAARHKLFARRARRCRRRGAQRGESPWIKARDGA